MLSNLTQFTEKAGGGRKEIFPVIYINQNFNSKHQRTPQVYTERGDFELSLKNIIQDTVNTMIWKAAKVKAGKTVKQL